MKKNFTSFFARCRTGIAAILVTAMTLVPALPAHAEEGTPPSLKELFAKENMTVGFAAPNKVYSDEGKKELALYHFNSLTCENECKPDALLDETTSKSDLSLYNESPAVNFEKNFKPALEFCKANGLKMRGHTLVWHNQTPEWLFHEDYDTAKPLAGRELMLKRMENYIKTVLEYVQTDYPGIVYAWDVVNEAFFDSEEGSGKDGEIRSTSNWYQTIGEDYIAAAFRFARRYAAEDVKLFYNDFNAMDPMKREGIMKYLSPVIEEDNIDGIGMQSHLNGKEGTSLTEIADAIDLYKNAGLIIHVTELDVVTKTSMEQDGDWEQELADFYYDYISLILKKKKNGAKIENVTFWGINDGDSWKYNWASKGHYYPLLFHDDLTPKKAFYSVVEALKNSSIPSEDTISEDFEGDITSARPRNQETLTIVKDGTARTGSGYLKVSGRTQTWEGAKFDVSDFKGRKITIEAWMRGTNPGKTNLKTQMELVTSGGSTYPAVYAAEGQKGEWIDVSGEFDVPEDVTAAYVYFETDNTADYDLDDVKITADPSGTDIPSDDMIFEKFEGDETSAISRDFGEKLTIMKDGTAKYGTGYLKVSERPYAWAAARFDVTAFKGKKITINAWMRGTNPGNTSLKTQMELIVDTIPSYAGVSAVQGPQNQWVNVGGTYEVPDYVDKAYVYFETDNTADYDLDNVKITAGPSELTYVDTSSYEVLKDLYEDYFIIGMETPNSLLKSSAHSGLIKKEFNSITLENECKPENLFDEATSKSDIAKYNESPAVKFNTIEPALKFCKENGMKMRGHTLIWHNQTPNWVFYNDYDESKGLAGRDLMLKRMESYIRQVLEYTEKNYPGIINTWDVVNEAINDNDAGDLRDTKWKETIGNDYIEKAYEFARKYAGKNVKLYYNDYNEYVPNKQNGIIKALKPVLEAGNIDGIGMQSHLMASWPSIEDYMSAVKKYAEAGFDIQVTELDIEKSNAEDWEETQKNCYYELMKNLIAAKDDGVNIESVTFWGISDEYSWKSHTLPLLFNKDLSKKGAFEGVVAAAQEANKAKDKVTPETKAALETAVAAASKYKEADYTAESWKAYMDAVNAAKKLAEKAGVTNTELRAAIQKVQNAEKALAKKDVKPQQDIKVQKVTITTSTLYKKAALGKTVQLKARVTPDNAKNKAVKWTSSNKKYAKVNSKGKVTITKSKAYAGKTVKITAKAADGSGKKAVYKITIMKDSVKKISLKAGKSVKAGKKMTVRATVKTTGKKANKKLVWTTSSKKYATVNSKGVVTTKKAGKGKTVKITAQATDGSKKRASVKIKIK